jgi:hypothetical protein
MQDMIISYGEEPKPSFSYPNPQLHPVWRGFASFLINTEVPAFNWTEDKHIAN